MKRIVIIIFTFLAFGRTFGQTDVQPLTAAQASFDRAAFEDGMRSAFLEFLGDDAVVFQPDAVNGRRFWTEQLDDQSRLLVRTLTYSDIAANGLLGYTTGNWRMFKKGKSESEASFGQYVTIWERSGSGGFRASLDIAVSHDKLPFSKTDIPTNRKPSRDINKRGWSPADASMDFFRTSMSGARLGGAYKKYAAEDVRLLRDGMPPIIGKKSVVAEMKGYVSIEFPTKVRLFQSADMAYTWNACQFDNSDEGREKGNCLHIWKLRNKKWRIVLGVFSPVPVTAKPELKSRPKR